ncbi:MAG: D-glycero-beta-D-manno-heptose 1,7-bisphosphate 7-phosphatase [Thermodesulfobacteriota bacterium]
MPEIKRAVFLDRDGTINEQMGYINHLDRFVLLPGVGRAIGRLNKAGLPVVVTSNQSGVARGYFPEELVTKVHRKMVQLLAQQGASVDGIYHCSHLPGAEVAAYRRDCDCRKPKPGLLLRAAEELGLDLPRSFVVGDKYSDLQAAHAVGAASVLVLTGYGRGELEYILPRKEVKPDFVAENLGRAVDWILSRVKAG